MAEIKFDAFDLSTDLGPSDSLACGWVPPDQRDAEGAKADSEAKLSIPPLRLSGSSVNSNATKVCLWDCWSAWKGGKWTGVRQITGSCVGAGGGNALFSLACADVLKRKDKERVEVPFWLLPYGLSRKLGGMDRRGDGSFGSTFAQAVREYGHLPANTEGLPAFREQDGFVWGEAAEMDWSWGSRIASKWLDQAKPHLVRSTAVCRSSDDVRTALQNYFPVTCASNWGGSMRPAVRGSREPVLLNSRTTTWMHQMSVQAFWNHPEFGELYWIQNQWGNCHGTCPSGAPVGGFWILKSDMDFICRQGETFAFSGFDGFPALEEPLDFSAF